MPQCKSFDCFLFYFEFFLVNKIITHVNCILFIFSSKNNCFSWTVNSSYFIYQGYAYTDFLEYPLLISQQIVLISMYLQFEKKSPNQNIFGSILVYVSILYLMTLGPAWLLQILIVSHYYFLIIT